MAGLSLQKIEAIAPDQASLQAARKLLKPAAWSGLSADGEGLVWGECQGSGAAPYRIAISEADVGYKCTCPSRKFPCKHSLALMWMRVEGKAPFEARPAPEWVQEWVRRRRPGGKTEAGGEVDDAGEPRPTKNIALSTAEELPPADPKAEARAAAARERSRLEREAAILAGLDDLDQWLTDQVEAGLGSFAANPSKACQLIAKRLVDAKAGGLANRLEELPLSLYALPDALRSIAALRELGQVHLLAEAWRRQESLSSELRADLRREIGWSVTREALLTDTTALRVTGTWRVFATVEENQQDRLRRIETWMWLENPGNGPRCAVLIDFVPIASGGLRSTWLRGERLQGTLVFYRSPVPLRAIMGELKVPGKMCSDKVALPDTGLADAWQNYERALAARPWLGRWPMHFCGARMRRSGQQLHLCSSDDAVTLPIHRFQTGSVAPLLAVEQIDGFALWDGSWLRMGLAQTELGFWGTV
jgi:SWIM zinc finger